MKVLFYASLAGMILAIAGLIGHLLDIYAITNNPGIDEQFGILISWIAGWGGLLLYFIFFVREKIKYYITRYQRDLIETRPWKDFPNTDNLPVMELTKDQYELAKDGWVVYVNGEKGMCFSMNGINWYIARVKEESNERN